jgi:predicted acylesterase/phospholipase RssA
VREEEPPDGSIGVALSGGGHRATVWAFGALLAMIDMGVGPKVTAVSSVSGGSFSNAVLAQELDLRTATRREADRAFGPMTRLIANDGLFLWGPSTNTYSLITYGLMGIGGLGIVVGLVVGLATHPWWWWVVALAGLAVLAVGAYAAEQRGRVVDAALARLFLNRGGEPTLLRDVERPVRHVLCATELQSGEHFYLCPDLVASWAFGRGVPGDLRLSTAVQISACVPAGFPPHRIPSSRFALRLPDGEVPEHAVLVDGGVYDNMAEEWFRPPDGGSPQDRLPDRHVDHLVLVNASPHAPWVRFAPSRWPLLSEFGTAVRSADIADDTTTSLRRRFEVGEWIRHAGGRGGALVSIASSPYSLIDARRTRDDDAQEPEDPGVQRAIDWLGGDSCAQREHWQRLVERDRAVRTTLGPLGQETTLDLLEHAYALTAVNLHLLLGYRLPAHGPSREQFEHLVHRAPREADPSHG